MRFSAALFAQRRESKMKRLRCAANQYQPGEALTPSCLLWGSKEDGKSMEKTIFQSSDTSVCDLMGSEGCAPSWEHAKHHLETKNSELGWTSSLWAPFLLKQMIFLFYEVHLSYSWRVRWFFKFYFALRMRSLMVKPWWGHVAKPPISRFFHGCRVCCQEKAKGPRQ